MQVLAGDQRAAQNRFVAGLLLALFFGVLAFLLARGVGLGVHAAAALVGAGLGIVMANGTVKRYERSIQSTWSQWMRFAVAADSVAEVFRKVHGRSGRNLPFLYAAVLFLAWGLEAVLLVLAFTAGEQSPALAVPVLALNGLVAGAIAGSGFVTARWLRTLRGTVAEMVESGEMGVWGVL
jgi:disulfide bond formation protein DsbB